MDALVCGAEGLISLAVPCARGPGAGGRGPGEPGAGAGRGGGRLIEYTLRPLK